MSLHESCQLIVDGYNVVFVGGLQSRHQNALALEKARYRLLRLMQSSLEAELLKKTIVVFDAKTAPISEADDLQKFDCLVEFADEYEDADSMIEYLIERNSSPKRLMVVSSDHRIQQAANRRGSTPIDSDLWLDRLESGNLDSKELADSKEDENSKQIPDQLSDIDWSKEFGLDEDSANGTEDDP